MISAFAFEEPRGGAGGGGEAGEALGGGKFIIP